MTSPIPASLRFPTAIFGLWLISMGTLLYLGSAFADQHILLNTLLAKWDGGWYQSIIANGYHFEAQKQSNVAFFPLYPRLASIIAATGVNPGVAGALVSLLSFWGALVVIYRLVCEQLHEHTARIVCLLIAFFPFSFFFGLSYTESLFLLLVAATLYLTSHHQWWLAAATTALAASTRLVGIFLIIVVAGTYIDSWESFKMPTRREILTLLGLATLSGVGILGFMVFLKSLSGDPLAFVHVQQYWPGREQGIGGLKTVAHAILNHHVFSNPYALNLTEIACLVAFTPLTVYTWIHINRWWALFSAAAIAAPLTSGSTISLNRYCLVLVPCFIAAAHLLKTTERAVFILIPSALLLAFYFHIYYTTPVFLG